jgi:hypothetical protein
MLLETGGAVHFQIRPIENVKLEEPLPQAEKLILDGQQRLTTLTQVLALEQPVKTRTNNGKAIDRFYYVHIPTAIEAPENLELALLTVDSSKQVKSSFGKTIDLDLSTRQRECEELYFPCNKILNWSEWLHDLTKFNPSQLLIFLQFQKSFITSFSEYQIPIIELKKETSKEAVCLVFEKVNTGGVPLSVFELMTASYAADGYNLRDDWFGSEIRNVESRRNRLVQKDALLDIVENTDFLQAITLLYTLKKRQQDIEIGKTGKQVTPVSAKRASVLELPLDAYKNWADKIETGFYLAANFLSKQSFYDIRELPYRTQIIPLAVILAELGHHWLEPTIHDKLTQWFWCGILGELYGGAVETRIANDVEEVLKWINESHPIPRSILDAFFRPERLDSLTSRLSAAYKGINTLVLREGAADLFWKATIQEIDAQEIALDIHHIFPRKWCEQNKIDKKQYDSIVNKTPISYRTNRMIGGVAPSVYLRKLQEHPSVQLDDENMNHILKTHLIDSQTLRSDDFDKFYRSRKQNLLGLIEKAMKKSVSSEQDLDDETV